MRTLNLVIVGALLGLAAQHGAAQPPLPIWKHLSSQDGALPPPNGGTQQTCCVIFDIDGDGAQDIVIGERTQAPALIAIRHTGLGVPPSGGIPAKAGTPERMSWQKLTIDDTFQTPEAGGAAGDPDGDGDLDLIVGGDYRSNELWWYENPKPNFDPQTPWKRHLIFKGPGKAFHDQALADFKGNGKLQLAFWNQGARKLFMAGLPEPARAAEPWPAAMILDTAKVTTAIKQEGMAAADVDGDGKTDLLAGIYWFKHEGGDQFKAIQVAEHPGRIAAGRFKPGKLAQIVLAPGDGDGPLLLIECAGDPADPQAWKSRDLLGRKVIHGHSLAVADVNGDGNLDILCGEMAKWSDKKPEGENPQAKSWLLYGDGRGGFKVTEFSTGIGFHDARLADVDGDGRLDVIDKPYHWKTPRLEVWLNQGNE